MVNSGNFKKNTPYKANEEDSMIWVWATLLQGRIDCYELIIRSLQKEEKEKALQEFKLFARLFGIKPDKLPKNYDDFLDYYYSFIYSDNLYKTKEAIDIKNHIFNFKPKLRPVFKNYEIVTSYLMPEKISDLYELPKIDKKNEKIAKRAISGMVLLNKVLPPTLKYTSAFIEANDRINNVKKNRIILGEVNKKVYGREKFFDKNRL